MPNLETYPDGAPFPGVIGRTTMESSPAWPTPRQAREGAPNVLVFVLDDVGFGQLSSFGGLVETPVIDRLAANGLRYTNMHTTALCSPSRGCILTGRNHHSLGLATISETSSGYPGYNAILPFDRGMLGDMLLPHGYNTFMVGKWHLTPPEHETPAGPYDRWPLARGFERFYGFLGGDTHQWYPELVYDNHYVDPPRTPEQGYHLSVDLADKAIEFIKDAHVNAPDKPFYLHYCTGAAHAPHHVPREWADRYAGRFDGGWDEYRTVVHQRQLDMGILPPGTALSDPDPDFPRWDTLGPDQRRLYARMMEVFAGFLSFTDHHFGRVIDFLEEIGELDNTLVMVVSDNGASSEGGPLGSVNEMFFFNNMAETLEENLAQLDELGGPTVFNHYPWGWTNAGNTPFRRWKRETYRGGVSDPFVLSWPREVAARGEIRTQYAHVIDLVPTILDALDLEPPATIRGVPQAPVEGVSFAHTFDAADADTKHHTQYFEMFGHRSIYHAGWRAVCPWPGASFTEAAQKGRAFSSPITPDVLSDIEAHDWELYDLTTDAAETHDVAAEHPDRLIEMVGRWWTEAGKYGVLPLDGDVRARLALERPTIAAPRDSVTYYPGGAPVPFAAAPKLYNRPFSITADVVVPAGGAEGVLLAQGGNTGGYSFYVKDRRLHFAYNILGREILTVTSDADVPDGAVSLRFEFEPTGEPDLAVGRGVPALCQLYIGDTLVGAMDMDHSVPLLFGTEGLTCGRDSGSRVAPDAYDDDFAFTGTLERVTVDVSGDLIEDSENDVRVAMARQ